MEQALSKDRKVIVYGIYFDFARATIKKESAPVLHEIADLMHRNPTWVLSINGYTDSIGGDAYNLALSKRRAAAVRDTLVTGFQIAASRLTSAGFGAASPVDSNSTLEGRARNRRVELIRR
jgi:outer membrane protein OmpA-like peptidoglycan-associated protein